MFIEFGAATQLSNYDWETKRFCRVRGVSKKCIPVVIEEVFGKVEEDFLTLLNTTVVVTNNENNPVAGTMYSVKLDKNRKRNCHVDQTFSGANNPSSRTV